VKSCASVSHTSTAHRHLYRKLLAQTEGRSIMIEEYARTQIATEELHSGEIEKMLRRPG
jgi:bacterioferritin